MKYRHSLSLLRLGVFATLLVLILQVAVSRVEASALETNRKETEQKSLHLDNDTQKAKLEIKATQDDENNDIIPFMTEDMIVGVHSTQPQHYRIESLKSTWMQSVPEKLVEVYSNISVDSSIPTLINTYLSQQGGYYDWRRATFMLKVWSTPPYKDVKWFVISHDAAYLHLENLYMWLSTRNESVPQVIGSVMCRADGLQYVNWRGTFVLSRGVLDHIDWDEYYAVERTFIRKADYSAEEIFGHYFQTMQIPLIHHPGFFAAPFSASSTLLEQFSQLKSDPNGWPLPYYPISSDQTDHLNFMVDLHQVLSTVSSHSTISNPYEPPQCHCKPSTSGVCHSLDDVELQPKCNLPNTDADCHNLKERGM